MKDGSISKYPIFLLMIFVFMLSSCNNKQESNSENTTIVEKSIDQEVDRIRELDVETYFSDSLGWGFDIFRNGKKYVHQPHIPAINGLMGFASEEDALAVANLMMDKLERNIVPPSVSPSEIDSLEIVISK